MLDCHGNSRNQQLLRSALETLSCATVRLCVLDPEYVAGTRRREEGSVSRKVLRIKTISPSFLENSTDLFTELFWFIKTKGTIELQHGFLFTLKVLITPKLEPHDVRLCNIPSKEQVASITHLSLRTGHHLGPILLLFRCVKWPDQL